MKSLVIYESRFGNTALIARAVADVLREHGSAHLLPVEDAADADLDGLDLLVVGGPTHAHGVPAGVGEWLERIPSEHLRDLPAAAFDTRYHMARLLTGSAAHVIERRLRRLGARVIAPPESFYVAASEGALLDGEGERAIDWAREIAGRIVDVRPATTGSRYTATGEHRQPHR